MSRQSLIDDPFACVHTPDVPALSRRSPAPSVLDTGALWTPSIPASVFLAARKGPSAKNGRAAISGSPSVTAGKVPSAKNGRAAISGPPFVTEGKGPSAKNGRAAISGPADLSDGNHKCLCKMLCFIGLAQQPAALGRARRSHRTQTHRFRETSAFQDNTLEACNVADPNIPAVGDGFLTNTSCGCSAVRVHSQRGR